ncbi:MAG: RIP metalloprotease RseP [Chlorobi bacterium]|nr:RIP metalloprotease RseP [Chlorobiota bacterium]MCI0714840.1 RIP metalloprotease RseP [Chlorobiota bacterium]
MSVVTTILYFLITIVILVFVHEFGHFIAAKLCRMRVDKFYLFFDFFNLRFFKFVKGDTEYGIGVFPLGGYVKVAGMIDESMDKDFIDKPPQPWEFRSKPVWQRMFVITAGVIMNTLLAFLIFYTINLMQGRTRIETTTLGYVSQNSVAQKYGIAHGDKIISINSKLIEYWDEVRGNIFIESMGEDVNLEIQRDGSKREIFIPKDDLRDIGERTFGIFPPDMLPEIQQVLPDKPASKSGLQNGDIIIEAAGQKINHSQQFVDIIKANPEKEISFKWMRNGTEMSGVVKPEADSTIGIGIGKYVGAVKNINYNVITAVPQGFNDLWHYGVVLFMKSMWKIIKGDIAFSKAVGGPIKIAQYAGQSAEGGFLSFLGFMAMLSITLAIINILPFPALDGGHFVFLLYEGIFRKPVSHKVQIVVQNLGFIILMLFMAFVVYNDIIHI